jgi:hypothetical protein
MEKVDRESKERGKERIQNVRICRKRLIDVEKHKERKKERERY